MIFSIFLPRCLNPLPHFEGAQAAPSAVVVEKKGLDPAAATKRLMAIVGNPEDQTKSVAFQKCLSRYRILAWKLIYLQGKAIQAVLLFRASSWLVSQSFPFLRFTSGEKLCHCEVKDVIAADDEISVGILRDPSTKRKCLALLGFAVWLEYDIRLSVTTPIPYGWAKWYHHLPKRHIIPIDSLVREVWPKWFI